MSSGPTEKTSWLGSIIRSRDEGAGGPVPIPGTGELQKGGNGQLLRIKGNGFGRFWNTATDTPAQIPPDPDWGSAWNDGKTAHMYLWANFYLDDGAYYYEALYRPLNKWTLTLDLSTNMDTGALLTKTEFTSSDFDAASGLVDVVLTCNLTNPYLDGSFDISGAVIDDANGDNLLDNGYSIGVSADIFHSQNHEGGISIRTTELFSPYTSWTSTATFAGLYQGYPSWTFDNGVADPMLIRRQPAYGATWRVVWVHDGSDVAFIASHSYTALGIPIFTWQTAQHTYTILGAA